MGKKRKIVVSFLLVMILSVFLFIVSINQALCAESFLGKAINKMVDTAVPGADEGSRQISRDAARWAADLREKQSDEALERTKKGIDEQFGEKSQNYFNDSSGGQCLSRIKYDNYRRIINPSEWYFVSDEWYFKLIEDRLVTFHAFSNNNVTHDYIVTKVNKNNLLPFSVYYLKAKPIISFFDSNDNKYNVPVEDLLAVDFDRHIVYLKNKVFFDASGLASSFSLTWMSNDGTIYTKMRNPLDGELYIDLRVYPVHYPEIKVRSLDGYKLYSFDKSYSVPGKNPRRLEGKLKYIIRGKYNFDKFLEKTKSELKEVNKSSCDYVDHEYHYGKEIKHEGFAQEHLSYYVISKNKFKGTESNILIKLDLDFRKSCSDYIIKLNDTFHLSRTKHISFNDLIEIDLFSDSKLFVHLSEIESIKFGSVPEIKLRKSENFYRYDQISKLFDGGRLLLKKITHSNDHGYNTSKEEEYPSIFLGLDSIHLITSNKNELDRFIKNNNLDCYNINLGL